MWTRRCGEGANLERSRHVQTAIFESNKLRASTYLPFFVLPGCNFFATGPDGGATGFGSPKPEFDAGDGSRRI
jgi:hypothetical protein